MRNNRLIAAEEIPYIPEMELVRTIENLKRRIQKLNPNWRLSRDESLKAQCLQIETEICYLQREFMFRKKRAAAHKEYILAHPRKKNRRAS